MAAALAMAQGVLAQADDLDALAMVDQAASGSVAPASPWRGFAEAAVSTSCGQDGHCSGANQRLSVDLGFDKRVAPGLRFAFESRLDVNARAQFHFPQRTHTLKEAYLAWQPDPRWTFDAGRINPRHGVGLGYNPTDFFRAHALRSVVSVDPASTRANRQGTVALRGQTVWDGGAVTALHSPRLSDRPSDATFSADLGSTNDRRRWLVTLSQQLGDGLSPQWLYYQEEGAEPQFGLNLSWAPHDAIVAFAEWKGGRSRSLRDAFMAVASRPSFHAQSTAGLTLSAIDNLTLTVEYQRNGAGLDKAQWQALAQSTPLALPHYLAWARDRQELPNRHALFALARWRHAIVRQLDLSALVRANLDDDSRMGWLEALYHLESTDLGVQWQVHRGRRNSEFGTMPPRQAWQLLLRQHF